MKTILFSALTAFFAVSTGCAAVQSGTTLNTVGPAPDFPVANDQTPRGTLLVFSAYETNSSGAGVTTFNDIRPHTAYKIYREDGTLLEKISNHTGAFGEDPSTVELAPGLYRVVANSNGNGLVTIPVRVVDHKLTAVHLDSTLPANARAHENSVVRLADGQIVGWNATP